jgi:rhodanese-related sulfurtransferase
MMNADPANIAAGNTAAISEGYRSNARSDELAASGIQAASGGNSWHNYAAAGDVIVLENGKWDQNNSSGLYTGALTEKFEANGLTNPYKNNDSGHFQPIEFTNAVPAEIKNGEQTVSDLLGVAEPEDFDNHLPPASSKKTEDLIPDEEVKPEDEKEAEKRILKARTKEPVTFKGDTTGLVPENWMSEVHQGTYKTTLYVVDQSIFNFPRELINDTAALNSSKATVISESGVESYYSLENLTINSTINPGSKGTNFVAGVSGSFELLEALGFTFFERMILLSGRHGFSTINTANFVLKIEFLGRHPESTTAISFPGVFFYPFKIAEASAQAGPDGSRYNITWVGKNINATFDSTTETDIKLENIKTANDFVNQLNVKLNESQASLRVGAPPVGKTYTVKFKDTGGFDFQNAVLQNTNSFAGLSINNADEKTYDFTIKKGSSVKQTIVNFLSNNFPEWNEYRLKKEENEFKVPIIDVFTDEEYEEGIDQGTGTNNKKIIYEIVVRWVFDQLSANNQIQSQKLKDQNRNKKFLETMINNGGIAKKYEYLFTGQNTEVIDFKLDFNALFTVAATPAQAGFTDAGQTASGAAIYPDKILRDAGVDTNKIKINKKSSADELLEKTNLSGIFLSDINIDGFDTTLATPIYDFITPSAEEQRVSDRDPKTAYAQNKSAAAQQYSAREVDMIMVELEIKGDPFWLGSAGSINTAEDNIVYNQANLTQANVALVLYTGDESLASTDEKRVVGRMELTSSGIYKVQRVSSRFQAGRMVQTLFLIKNRNLNPFYVQNELKELGGKVNRNECNKWYILKKAEQENQSLDITHRILVVLWV